MDSKRIGWTVDACRFLPVAVLLFIHPLAFSAQEYAGQKGLLSIDLMPHQATLWGTQASQHFLVLGKYADGLERDLPSVAGFSISHPAQGQIDSTGKFVARNAGETAVTATVGSRSAKA